MKSIIVGAHAGSACHAHSGLAGLLRVQSLQEFSGLPLTQHTCAQAGHAAAQVTVTTSMVELSLTNTQPVFGTLEGYGTILQVPLGSPTPPGGTITFLNGTQVLATTNLASGVLVINGNNVVCILASHAGAGAC